MALMRHSSSQHNAPIKFAFRGRADKLTQYVMPVPKSVEVPRGELIEKKMNFTSLLMAN